MLALAGCGSNAEAEDGPGSGIDSLPMGTSNAADTEPGADTAEATSAGTGAGTTSGVADGSGTDEGEDGVQTKFDIPWGPDLGGSSSSCQTDPNADEDGDGFSVVAGDCNDCDANVNPGAVEVEITEPDDMGMIPDPADEDCDGFVDNVAPPCDAGLALDSNDAYDAAAAIGLCKISAGADDWGIIDAQYTRANGDAVGNSPQHGLMGNFGPNITPLEGSSLLVVSSGRGRIPGQPGACGSLTCTGTGGGTAPGGFPQDVPGCAGSSSINDDIALEVTLRAPTNATGYAFSFDFYSFEYPEWVCTAFNDQFIALVDPPPPGSINGNISFDAMTNPVSVNIAFFEVCAGCPLGTAELQGTGFDTWDDAGATSWLATTAPVDPGQIVTIRFAIWDTGDSAWDSTALIDNFRWIADGGSVTVGTTPEG